MNLKLFLCLFCFYKTFYCKYNNYKQKSPTVLIAINVRNKEHTLPYFLSLIEDLNYPKDRIALWIRCDHSADNSIEILKLWKKSIENAYHLVNFDYENYPIYYQNETSILDWPKARFSHVINLKENILEYAETIWADFLFFLDADVFLTNRNTLLHLISYNLPIVAPMLFSESLYSNFWCGMSDEYYYRRTDEYMEIYNNKKIGNFHVPMVHTAVLINLNIKNSKMLTFDKEKLINNQKNSSQITRLYNGTLDDIIVFAVSANSSNMQMYISNKHNYGYVLAPLEHDDSLYRDYQQLVNIKLIVINDLNKTIQVKKIFKSFIKYPEKTTITLDKIYMINLNRRLERKNKMDLCFKELGLNVERFPAIDGRYLNFNAIKEMGIEFLQGYEDPYHHRPMTMGEIGCFLSHYKIWQKIVKLNQDKVLILEDDIRFEPYFIEKTINILQQAKKIGQWDLIYFGRKRLEDQDEPWVDETDNLVHVGYSYWTLGYLITLQGAKKLIDANPLKKLLPVDEFLPIMFNRHPNETWKSKYELRNLVAYSAAPLLLYPTHYTGDDGYISDTEDSLLTPNNLDGKYFSNYRNSDHKMKSMLFRGDGNFPYPNTEIISDLTGNLPKHERNEL